MDLRIQNKVIIVAGDAQGIGEAIADHLMGEGALPVALDRIAGKGFSLIVEFNDRHSMAKAVRIVQEHFGHIDGLVNIAGSSLAKGQGSDDFSLSALSFEENVGQYYSVAQAFQSHLKVSKGSIVNILSKLWETEPVDDPKRLSTTSVRAALTEQWADELRVDGIRVNGVLISDLHSTEFEAWIDRTRLQGGLWKLIKKPVPLGSRLTKAEEIAGTVAFLLSRQSSTVNGKILRVGGGYIHLDRTVGSN